MEAQAISVEITPLRDDSRWVAIDENNAILFEGKTPEEVIIGAEAIGKNYMLMFVPVKGATYIF